MSDAPDRAASSRLDLLLPLLSSDPGNLRLLSDAAETALAERRPAVAADLLDRYSAIAPLPPMEANLAGLAALELRRFDRAEGFFAGLADSGHYDSAIRFNLAWARSMQKDFDGALQVLGEEVADELPQAAMLKVQILHEQGRFDEAAELGRGYLARHPDHQGLLAAMSVLALDVEDEALAALCAGKAGQHPDALTTLGTLALGEERASEARENFEAALSRNRGAPRAWVGLGLAKLMTDEPAAAAADIDRGAELFGDHLGSWIAAGWAHFVNGDLGASRERFETALRLDPTFAESHGSLAVVDLVEGDSGKARERADTARRLDRQCYSAALAHALLAGGSGDKAGARRIFDLALDTPVDKKGRTIAQAMARLGLSPP